MEGIQVSTQVAGSQNQISIIKVGGFIDTTTSSEVERALNSLLKQNRYNVIIDLGNVDYISSAGWGIFISEIKSIRENNGDLKLVQMIPDVYEIFELLEFHHILDVYDSVDEAVQKFEQAPRKPEPVPMGQEPAHTSGAQMQQSKGFEGGEGVTRSESPSGSSKPATEFEEGEEEPKELPLSMRSVEDKIKYIVSKNPNLGAYKINKILNTEEFGYTKVGWFGVRSYLSELGLNSRHNRRTFAQQYADNR